MLKTIQPAPTGSSNSITVRLRLEHRAGILAKVTSVIGDLNGNIGAIDIIKAGDEYLIRDVTIDTSSQEHAEEIVGKIKSIRGVEVINYSDRTFLLHLGGKIETKNKIQLKTRDDLSMAYTPGVARVCEAIHASPDKVFNLTIKKNTVAIVTDGTAVLGLGDIGPQAALPVMEGKAMLFKEFGNVDAFPICLDTKDPEEIIQTVKNISPVFGGINLEDIAAPRCFEIEKKLMKILDIPVFHDDQHGTAVVVAAGFINALKVVKKEPGSIKIIVAGVGAAGTACTRILLQLGAKNIIGFDRKGAISPTRKDLNEAKKEYLKMTNPEGLSGSIHNLMQAADVFIGLSGPNVIDEKDLQKMNPDPIIFAMSNPTPEIQPEVAQKWATVLATGRSDYANQINNVLCFPGIFRGALDARAKSINEEMKMAAAMAIAKTIEPNALSAEYIIPSVFDSRVVPHVAKAVAEAAIKTGVGSRR